MAAYTVETVETVGGRRSSSCSSVAVESWPSSGLVKDSPGSFGSSAAGRAGLDLDDGDEGDEGDVGLFLLEEWSRAGELSP